MDEYNGGKNAVVSRTHDRTREVHVCVFKTDVLSRVSESVADEPHQQGRTEQHYGCGERNRNASYDGSA
jgi:hypothetical protein